MNSYKPISQEEFDSHYRDKFVKSILEEANSRHVRFVVVVKRNGLERKNLFDLWREFFVWRWTFGKGDKRTYYRSEVVNLLETIWDEWMNETIEFIFLNGEFEPQGVKYRVYASIDENTFHPVTDSGWENYLASRKSFT